MVALGRLPTLRHAAVGLAVVGSGVLGITGVVGSSRPERFDAKQVTVAPTGADGLRIREVVDQDFGRRDRHGYERIVPNDFGVPTDVVAESPDAPDDVDVTTIRDDTQIRIGDPDETISGQHRYVVEYTLPAARLSSGELALDVIGTEEELGTERFEIVVTGLVLDAPQCNVGAEGDSGGCALTRDGDVYRAVIEDLEPGQGITIGGTITGRTDVVDVAAPALPAVPGDHRVPLGLGMAGLAAGVAGGVYAYSRRRGRNEVFAGGATEAAFGAPLPAPGAAPPADGRVRFVADEEMDELATIEFEPPRGVPPWLGAVLLRERIDPVTVGAWFAGLAARDVITMTSRGDDGDDVELGIGPRFGSADPEDAPMLRQLFADGPTVALGKYDKDFAAVWRQVRTHQERVVARSGYWKRLAPSAGGCGANLGVIAIVAAAWLVISGGVAATILAGVVGSPLAALAAAGVVAAIVAFAAYRSLLPARSATGSALALRTESFRRFLAASEGRHVEWAWKHGLLREYSAWAVALAAADAWGNALEQSSVPPTEYHTGPLLVHSMARSFSHTYTAPSSSGSGGRSGGFSGGSVGGGGGGGSSGSW